GEEGRGDDPRVLQLRAAEVRDDDRQRVADDRAGEHGDEEREEQAGEDLHHLAVLGLLHLGAAAGAGHAVGAGHQRATSWVASRKRATVPRTSVSWATSDSLQSVRADSR